MVPVRIETGCGVVVQLAGIALRCGKVATEHPLACTGGEGYQNIDAELGGVGEKGVVVVVARAAAVHLVEADGVEGGRLGGKLVEDGVPPRQVEGWAIVISVNSSIIVVVVAIVATVMEQLVEDGIAPRRDGSGGGWAVHVVDVVVVGSTGSGSCSLRRWRWRGEGNARHVEALSLLLLLP